jgi:hypothetical protein
MVRYAGAEEWLHTVLGSPVVAAGGEDHRALHEAALARFTTPGPAEGGNEIERASSSMSTRSDSTPSPPSRLLSSWAFTHRSGWPGGHSDSPCISIDRPHML